MRTRTGSSVSLRSWCAPAGALGRRGAARGGRRGAREGGGRGGGDQPAAAGAAGGGLAARGDVDRVADGAEVEPPGAADRAGDDAAGVDPDADLQLGAGLVDR